MTARAPFLSERYGAYYHRDVPKEDEELTHVGPGTPCGEYLRRFCHPVAISDHVKELPVAVRVMGEDLVLFRDRKGRLGLLELHCAHRGTSLEYGQVEEEGIRCCYHGWLYRVDGAILDTPGEPPESTFKDRLCQGAYPVREFLGMVFAYIGPPDKQPEFPIYDVFDVPGYCYSKPVTHHWPCNWLQVKENAMDPIHTAVLHTIDLNREGNYFTEAFKEFGVLDWMETPIGTAYVHTRRSGDLGWVRMLDFILPTMHQIAASQETATEEHGFSLPWITYWLLPVDDTNCITYKVFRVPGSEPIDPPFSFGQDGERPYEDRQRVPGDWDAQVSQRPIAIHGLEHLGATDRGITMLRRQIRQGIRAVEAGQDPKGIVRGTGEVVPTYTTNTVLRIPPAPTPEEDRSLLADTGNRVAKEYMNDPPSRAGASI